MTDVAKTAPNLPPGDGGTIRLHIGGTEPRKGWRILNIQPGPHVDLVGDCVSLSQFADNSVERIYASHVYEHLGFREELRAALSEAHRVLIPGGLFQISVPDFAAIAAMIIDPARAAHEQFQLMGYLYGTQRDPHDFHKMGFTAKILAAFLRDAGFPKARRVGPFGLFNDWSGAERFDHLISLNVETRK